MLVLLLQVILKMMNAIILLEKYFGPIEPFNSNHKPVITKPELKENILVEHKDNVQLR